MQRLFAGEERKTHLFSFHLPLRPHMIKRGLQAERKIPQQRAAFQMRCHLHADRMDLAQDIEVDPGLLPQQIRPCIILIKDIVDKADSLIVEIDAQPALTGSLAQGLRLPDVQPVDQVIPLEQGRKKGNPANNDNQSEQAPPRHYPKYPT